MSPGSGTRTSSCSPVACGGPPAAARVPPELALRLKYAGIDPARIHVQADLPCALREAAGGRCGCANAAVRAADLYGDARAARAARRARGGEQRMVVSRRGTRSPQPGRPCQPGPRRPRLPRPRRPRPPCLPRPAAIPAGRDRTLREGRLARPRVRLLPRRPAAVAAAGRARGRPDLGRRRRERAGRARARRRRPSRDRARPRPRPARRVARPVAGASG